MKEGSLSSCSRRREAPVAKFITRLKGEITETRLLFILVISNTGNLVPLSKSGERGQKVHLESLVQRRRVCVCRDGRFTIISR